MLIGHQKQWEYLRKSVQLDRIANAYLFYGPSGVGKKTAAFNFIKLINSKSLGKDLTEKSNLPEFYLIEPKQEGRPVIAIEEIRKLKKSLSLYSLNSYKAAVIDQAHFLTHDAQSALLKLLEEPKGRAVIILVTEYPELLFPTIVSRCQLLRFWFVPQSVINEYFKNIVGISRAKEISLLALGRPGVAFNIIGKSREGEFQKQRINDIIKLRKLPFGLRFQYAFKLAKDRQILKKSLEIWLNYFRLLMIRTIEGEPVNLNYSLSQLKEIINQLQDTYFLLSFTNTSPRLALEILLMKF